MCYPKSMADTKDIKDLSEIKDEDLELLGPKVQKVYRGAYRSMKGNNVFSEETFDVYRDKKELTFTFITEAIARVSTGELLKIYTNYQVGKDFVPLYVQIKKDLGKESSEEIFKLDDKKNILKYTFKSKRSKETQEITVPPRFHISTPTFCTSMLFFLSKKFDATSKNYYTVYQSMNKWDFEHPLVSKSIGLERISLTSETIFISGVELQAVQYKVFEDPKTFDPTGMSGPSKNLFVYLSRYHAIPYSIRGDDNLIIQVKYFNNLAGEDS
jgi:hypothetical protein